MTTRGHSRKLVNRVWELHRRGVPYESIATITHLKNAAEVVRLLFKYPPPKRRPSNGLISLDEMLDSIADLHKLTPQELWGELAQQKEEIENEELE